ncbi:hypothetical protein [Streptosporangium sp. NPDC000396]|uniref:hypothetical protein n=1 Tax=Streptosporangium sp. NPDC000396 TaxID=3366185 RepID=UPI0036C1941D
MTRVVDEDESAGNWTLLDEEMELLAGRRGPTKEVFKFGAIEAVGLPEGVSDDVAPGVLPAGRARVVAEAPSHLRASGGDQGDVAGGLSVLPPAGDHQRLGRSADHHGAADQCSRRHQGDRGVRGTSSGVAGRTTPGGRG